MFVVKKLLLLCSLVFVLLWPQSRADLFPECVDANAGTYIASPLKCSSYIYCDGDESFSGECGEDEYFNPLFQTCDPASEVDCALDTNNASTTTSATSIVTEVTPIRPGIPNLTIPSLELTSPSTIESSTASSSTLSTSSTALSSTTSSSIAVTEGPVKPGMVVVSASCPEVDMPGMLVLVPHPKSCSAYFICFHGEEIQMHCSAMLHFDIKTGKCDYPERSKCQAAYFKPREQCLSQTIDVYPHPGNCNYFYLCKYGYLMLQQCPLNFVWDHERRACVVSSDAKCHL